MIVKNVKTTVGYRCPTCGGNVLSPVGAFLLNADRLKLNCPCKKSDLEICITNDDKVRLTVPCLVCGGKHTYTVSKSIFFGRDIFVFSCAMSGVDICFFGEQDKVIEALDEQMKLLRSFAGEEDEESAEEMADIHTVRDPQVHNVVNFVLKELAAENAITCGCTHEGKGKGDYDFDYSPAADSVRIFCHRCRKEEYIPLSAITESNAFVMTDEINLR